VDNPQPGFRWRYDVPEIAKDLREIALEMARPPPLRVLPDSTLTPEMRAWIARVRREHLKDAP
jgi:hypothetical protein